MTEIATERNVLLMVFSKIKHAKARQEIRSYHAHHCVGRLVGGCFLTDNETHKHIFKVYGKLIWRVDFITSHIMLRCNWPLLDPLGRSLCGPLNHSIYRKAATEISQLSSAWMDSRLMKLKNSEVTSCCAVNFSRDAAASERRCQNV